MMDPVLSVSYATIAAFFEAAEGNHRNAVYVSCSYQGMTAAPSCSRFPMRRASWAGRWTGRSAPAP